MNFGETLYGIMYEILSPYGMQDLAPVRRAWDYFPFGDLSEAQQNNIQAAFKEVLQKIVAYLSENGLTIADLMENEEWKSGNEDFIGLLSQLAKSIGSTYDSTTGALVFSADGRTINGVFPFVAVKAAAVATDMKYLINGSTLSAIADAIRAKTGETGTIVANDFATKIAAIPTGVAKPSWIQTTLPANTDWYSVCYGDGKFVAVASDIDTGAYSTDGINWTSMTMPSGSSFWGSVCYGNGKFVAVSYGGTVENNAAYSTDGINWIETGIPIFLSSPQVCYGDGKFVVIDSDGNSTFNISYSINGIDWNSFELLVDTHDIIQCYICYGQGKFVIVFLGGSISTYLIDSLGDGDIESYKCPQISMPANGYWSSVCYGDGNFVAVCGASNISAYLKDYFDEWA